jgi:hypothetical protein
MQFPDVLATLLDLPSSFTRQTPWFTQLMDALGFEIALETKGNDGIAAQVQSFANAQDGWIDIWGLLFGIPRNVNEGNGPYSARIQETILAWVGTPAAVQKWLNLFAASGTNTENSSSDGYAINLPSTLSNAQIAFFLTGFNRIRPDGVPFTLTQGPGALFLGTVDYLGIGNVIGTYITTGETTLDLTFAGVTNNSSPLLPTLMLTDPILNPSLYPAQSLP